MNTPVCRLLPYEIADGPANMAADEVLLETAVQGSASLRFYGWSEATLSLGYFQPASVRFADSLLADRPFVRRPTGGATLLHDHELTYALAIPSSPSWRSPTPWLLRMHRTIALALGRLGAQVAPHASEEAPPFTGNLCFQHWTEGDLIAGSNKITGSAQRKQRGALLQHGSILLAQSSYTPMLPGIRELTGKDLVADAVGTAVLEQLQMDTRWQIEPATWTAAEIERRQALIVARYANDAWNKKR
jgi:lipoate-protein ligase A